jgi:hypothetical protein
MKLTGENDLRDKYFKAMEQNLPGIMIERSIMVCQL